MKYDLSLQSNDYEIVDFLMDRFKLATGIGEPKQKPPSRRYKHETERYDMEGEYVGGESKRVSRSALTKAVFDS